MAGVREESMAIGAKQLENTSYGIEGYDHDHSVLYFHSVCHKHSDVTAMYRKASKTVLLSCASCKKPIIELQIADGELDDDDSF